MAYRFFNYLTCDLLFPPEHYTKPGGCSCLLFKQGVLLKCRVLRDINNVAPTSHAYLGNIRTVNTNRKLEQKFRVFAVAVWIIRDTPGINSFRLTRKFLKDALAVGLLRMRLSTRTLQWRWRNSNLGGYKELCTIHFTHWKILPW